MDDIAFWNGHSHIVFMGDSRIRKLYYEFIGVLGDADPEKNGVKHSDMQYKDEKRKVVVVRWTLSAIFSLWDCQIVNDLSCCQSS